MTLVSNSPLNRLVVVAAAPVYCGVGKYAPAGASVGTDCAADSYSDTPGATSCKPCPAGWTTTGQGETSLSTCSFPAHAYLVCSGGNTTALFDYDGCSNVPCIPGSFGCNATTSTSYWDCFMPVQPYIRACFYSTADKENGHSGIIVCPEPPCPAGFYSPNGRGGGTGHTCSPCDAGSYSDTPGATSCKPHPARFELRSMDQKQALTMMPAALNSWCADDMCFQAVGLVVGGTNEFQPARNFKFTDGQVSFVADEDVAGLDNPEMLSLHF